MRPSLSVETALKELGANLKTARLRRRLPQNQVAERAGVSLNTLSKVESGDPGVAIGNVASVIQAIGLDVSLLGKIASPINDLSGIKIENERLPQRARSPKRSF
ncbi:MAG TPA: transcriptional regulator [Sutterella sp.]|nr:transcriptional regulator [Sutterella sp.]